MLLSYVSRSLDLAAGGATSGGTIAIPAGTRTVGYSYRVDASGGVGNPIANALFWLVSVRDIVKLWSYTAGTIFTDPVTGNAGGGLVNAQGVNLLSWSVTPNALNANQFHLELYFYDR